MVYPVVLLFVGLACVCSGRFHDSAVSYRILSKLRDTPAEKAIDYFLCRHCGADIAPLSSLISIDSPAASAKRVTQLFGLKDVKVQTIENELHLRFEILTLSKSLCAGRGIWKSENSWFPGYVWKVCVCSQCGRHIGWMFEPLQGAYTERLFPSKEGFYVVIISSVINEFHADSLIVVPKHFSTVEEVSD